MPVIAATPEQAHKTFDILKLVSKTNATEFFSKGLAPGSIADLIMSASVAGDADRVAMLLKQGDALPDFKNEYGVTPLMAAAARGHVQVLEVLAAHPLVTLSRQTADGWTALHYAAWFDMPKAVSSLMAHHAPWDIRTTQGKTPHDLAAGRESEKVFWQDREFTRLMKKKQPEVISPLPVAPVEAPAAPAVDKAAEAEAVFRAANRAVVNLGVALMEEKDTADIPARDKIDNALARMNVEDFREAFHKIEETKLAYNWKDVFIKASETGNTDLMQLMQNTFWFDQRTLNQALSAAVVKPGNRDAVHRLVLWHANPQAPFERNALYEGRNILDAAFLKSQSGAIEEMVLWADGTLGDKKDYRKYAMLAAASLLSAQRSTGPRETPERKLLRLQKALDAKDLLAVMVLWNRKNELKGMRAKKLRDVFNTAVEKDNLTDIMAGYAEARIGRFWRGAVEMTKESGATAIARALQHDRFEFARILIADGYHLKDAPAHLRHKITESGSERAKQFAADHLSGKMKVQPIDTLGDMKPSPSTHIILPPYGMGRYGM